MISHQHKLIFIHIPKCAGTSIEEYIKTYAAGIGHRQEDGLKWTMRREGLAKTINSYPDYKLFTIVRNPFDRFVSLWMHSQRGVGQYYARPNKDEGVSLEDYAKLIYEKRTSELSQFDIYHSLPQVNFIIDLHPNYYWKVKLGQARKCDAILRFENLEDHFYEFCKRIKVPAEAKLPSIFKSERDANFESYFDHQSQELVRKIYQKDFEALGYEDEF